MRVRRALVVGDDAHRASAVSVVAGHAAEVRVCDDVAAAGTLLEGWEPDLVVLAVPLPEGRAEDVLKALARRADPLAQVRAAVGHVPLPAFEGQVRRAMIDEAIRRTAGNRRRAAALLGVSRQFLQHALRRRDDD